ncbi:MAG: GAF domain-containing protein [Pyrinomonadaceae bacterium]
MTIRSQTNEQGIRRTEPPRRAEIMHAMMVLARELNAATGAGEGFQIALQALSRMIPADALSITLSDADDRQKIHAMLVSGSGEVETPAAGELVRVRHTMLARAVETGLPVRFNNVSAELVSGALVLSLVCPGAQSVLCAPLMVGERPTGIIIASTTRVAAYTEADMDVAGVVANLLASARARLELSEQATGARRREEERLREAALIEQLDAAARSSVNLDRIIQHAVDAVSHALPASFVVLRPVSFGRPEPTLRAWTPGHDRPPLEIHAPISKAERAVYTEHRPIFIEDVRAERVTDRDLGMVVERLGARSLYIAPIVYGGQILAAIGLVESDAQRRWTQEEQSRLTRVSETIAPLILNTQLHTRLRSHIEDILTLLRLAGDVLSEAELERALRAVLDSWAVVVGTDAAAILRWDEESQLLRLAATKHLPTGILERYTQGVPLTDPIVGLAAEKRVPVVADLASETHIADLHAAVRWSGLRGAWATPITGVSGKLLGVLVMFSRVASQISTDEQRLADLFTRPAALAMQNLEWSSTARAQGQQIGLLEKSLQDSEQHKTEFMSVISHELRTPLNAIMGYAQMLKDGFSGDLNEQQRIDVQTIIDSADRLLSMVEDTLDLARIDAERFPLYMDTVAFDEVIRRAIADVRSSAEAKGLNIELQISEDMPVVRTDPERVRQILTNLLSNAVKFTERGSVLVQVQEVDAGSVQISVADTGIGFDTTAFPHIFEEFRQADASNTRIHGGTGLGLAVSKRLVQRLGGHIGVTSMPGEGSTFWFRLPPEMPGAEG